MAISKESLIVGLVMGSKSDWETMQVAAEILQTWNITFEAKVVSAHRTPDLLVSYAKAAVERGLQIIIAGAGGAAHLPGMLASMTDLPVIGVPIQSKALNGLDSLLSMVQMPQGVPVATVAIGSAGAANAALLALRILALHDSELQKKLTKNREAIAAEVLSQTLEMPK